MNFNCHFQIIILCGVHINGFSRYVCIYLSLDTEIAKCLLLERGGVMLYRARKIVLQTNLHLSIKHRQ